MGFLAGELAPILQQHAQKGDPSPWIILLRLGVHPMQVERLQHAAEDFGMVATLPASTVAQLRQDLGLSPGEYARLKAASEADAFMRLMLYHNYPLEEAANKSNAVFANNLKDKLATGGNNESVYPTLGTTPMMPPSAVSKPRKKPGRPVDWKAAKKDEVPTATHIDA